MKAGDADYVVLSEIRSDTINVVRVWLHKIGGEKTLCGDLPYVGADHPQAFMHRLMMIANTVRVTIQNLHLARVHIDEQSFVGSLETAVRAIAEKLRHTPLNADGKKELKTRGDGSVAVIGEDAVEVVGMDGSGVPEVDDGVTQVLKASIDPEPSNDEGHPEAPGQGRLILPS